MTWRVRQPTLWLSTDFSRLIGYTLMMWHDVVQWPKDEYQVFLMRLRRAIRNPKVHSYMTVRYVYARK